MKVVRPEWLVESVKAGVLLSWQDFIFKAGPRIDESQGKKVAQKSLFDNFVAQQSIKNPEVLNTPKSVRIDVNSSPCTNSSEYQSPVPTVTPSAKSSPPTQAHYTPWIVPVPTTSSPEMPPLRQPPRPSTPDMSISASSTHRENPTLRPPTFSLSDPISQPDPSPPPPGQRPRQLTESPEHSDPAQPSQEPEVTPLPNTEHPSEPSMHLIPTPSRASPLIYSTHLPPTPQSPRLLQLSSQSKPKYASFDSNPNAARVMANPAWRAAHTSVAPDFIEGYYRNSRLHHLASWKAELRGLVVEALEKAESGPSDEGGSASGEVERVHKDETEEEHDPVVRVLRENMGGKSGTVVLPSGEGDSNVSMRDAQLALHSPSKKFKGKEKDTKINDESQARVIMHCDFDSFFVSAGLVDRPHLRGKPVVVCHSQGAQGGQASTSEIASASYEARKFGIKGGMRFVFLLYLLRLLGH